MKKLLLISLAACISGAALAQKSFNGLDMNMGNLYRLSDAKTRSISPENFTGELRQRRHGHPRTGQRQKRRKRPRPGLESKSLYIHIEPGKTFTLAEINGSGAIQHIWMTLPATGVIPFSVFTGTMKPRLR